MAADAAALAAGPAAGVEIRVPALERVYVSGDLKPEIDVYVVIQLAGETPVDLLAHISHEYGEIDYPRVVRIPAGTSGVVVRARPREGVSLNWSVFKVRLGTAPGLEARPRPTGPPRLEKVVGAVIFDLNVPFPVTAVFNKVAEEELPLRVTVEPAGLPVEVPESVVLRRGRSLVSFPVKAGEPERRAPFRIRVTAPDGQAAECESEWCALCEEHCGHAETAPLPRRPII